MARALVFGGSGWIGGGVRKALGRHGLEAVTADLREPGDGSAYIPVDIGSLDEVMRACRESAPAVVLNLAYLLAPATEADLLRSERINLAGVLNVFEACRRAGVRRCVFASSIAVYGDQSLFGAREVGEGDFGRPALLYGWHKLLNEASAACFERDRGVECVALRLSTVFGPGPAAINQGLNDLIAAVGRGGPATCPLTADSELNLLHVEDAAEAFALLAAAPQLRHRVYNSGGETVSTGGLLEILARLRPGAEIAVQAVGKKVPRVTRVDWSRLREELDVRRPPLEARLAADLDLAASSLLRVVL